MSRAGCPYDNAVIERFFNTLKSEFIHLNKFESLQHLNSAMSRYINLWYNYKRPHSYNGNKSPLQIRYSV